MSEAASFVYKKIEKYESPRHAPKEKQLPGSGLLPAEAEKILLSRLLEIIS